jgi:hypothetical protein
MIVPKFVKLRQTQAIVMTASAAQSFGIVASSANNVAVAAKIPSTEGIPVERIGKHLSCSFDDVADSRGIAYSFPPTTNVAART